LQDVLHDSLITYPDIFYPSVARIPVKLKSANHLWCVQYNYITVFGLPACTEHNYYDNKKRLSRIMHRIPMMVFNLGLGFLKIESTIKHINFTWHFDDKLVIPIVYFIGHSYLLARRRRASARQAAPSYLVIKIVKRNESSIAHTCYRAIPLAGPPWRLSGQPRGARPRKTGPST
jgi:hypothetical protein